MKKSELKALIKEGSLNKSGRISWDIEGNESPTSKVFFTSNRIKDFKTELKNWGMATGINIEFYDIDPKTISISINDIVNIFMKNFPK
jgi:hypothetical protein